MDKVGKNIFISHDSRIESFQLVYSRVRNEHIYLANNYIAQPKSILCHNNDSNIS